MCLGIRRVEVKSSGLRKLGKYNSVMGAGFIRMVAVMHANREENKCNLWRTVTREGTGGTARWGGPRKRNLERAKKDSKVSSEKTPGVTLDILLLGLVDGVWDESN